MNLERPAIFDQFIASLVEGKQLAPQLKPVSLYVGRHLGTACIKHWANPTKEETPQIVGNIHAVHAIEIDAAKVLGRENVIHPLSLIEDLSPDGPFLRSMIAYAILPGAILAHVSVELKQPFCELPWNAPCSFLVPVLLVRPWVVQA